MFLGLDERKDPMSIQKTREKEKKSAQELTPFQQKASHSEILNMIENLPSQIPQLFVSQT